VEERIVVRLILDTSGYRKGATDARSATDQVTDSVGRGRKGIKDLATEYGGLAKVAVGAFAVKAAGDFARDSIRAATELGESVNAVQKVFGSASDTVLSFGQVSAQAAGLAASEFNSLATNTGSLLQNFGFSAQEAANQSIRLGIRAADMASVFNTDVDQALGAINAALRGETEQIRFFGVSLDDASVKAKAVEMGLASTTSEVDKNAKATAALQLIYEQTSKTQGDFADTSTDLANAQRIAGAELENAKAELGAAAAAPLASLTNMATDVILSLRALDGDEVAKKSLRFREAMETIQAASDDIETGNLAAVANGILHIATNSDLAYGDVQALGSAAGLSTEQIEGLGEVLLARAAEMGFTEEELAELNDAFFMTPEAAAAAGEGLEETEGDLEDVKTAAQLARESYENYLTALAESTDSALKAVNSLGSLQEAQKKVSDLADAGKTDTDEYRLAQLELAAQVFETQAALDEFSGGNIEDAVAGIAEALGISHDAAQDLLEDLGLLDGKEVTSVVTVDFKTRGDRSAGSFFGKQIGDVLISGQRAMGGPVDKGSAYIVGEQGRELFIPNESGQIIPNGQFGSAGSGGVNITVNYPEHRGDDLLHSLQTATTLVGLTRYAETSPGRG